MSCLAEPVDFGRNEIQTFVILLIYWCSVDTQTSALKHRILSPQPLFDATQLLILQSISVDPSLEKNTVISKIEMIEFSWHFGSSVLCFPPIQFIAFSVLYSLRGSRESKSTFNYISPEMGLLYNNKCFPLMDSIWKSTFFSWLAHSQNCVKISLIRNHLPFWKIELLLRYPSVLFPRRQVLLNKWKPLITRIKRLLTNFQNQLNNNESHQNRQL